MSLDRKNIRIKKYQTIFDSLNKKKADQFFTISCQNENGSLTNQDYLDQVKRIQQQAKQTSKTVNLEFRKYSKKPEVQTVYVDSSKVQSKLQQMNTRIDMNKYQMIIQVKKDAIDNLAIKKPVVKDQIQNKNYRFIYKQFLKDKNTGEVLSIRNPIISLYQFYDEEEKDWRDSLKQKRLICRQMRKETQQRIAESLSRRDQGSLDGSRVKFQVFINDNNYSQQFQQLAETNELFVQKKPVLNPQNIVIDRFQTKFYKCRQKKFQHVFDRMNQQQQNQAQKTPKQQVNWQTVNNMRNIKLKIPQSCKKIYNTQNKMLESHINNGLSKDNARKLVIEFNKTILDMKAHQQQKEGTKNKQFKKIVEALNNQREAEKKSKKFFNRSKRKSSCNEIINKREITTSEPKTGRINRKGINKMFSYNGDVEFNI